jgi:murein DD-endopeptidase MepM/ murein hydrolase activator NlpD
MPQKIRSRFALFPLAFSFIVLFTSCLFAPTGSRAFASDRRTIVWTGNEEQLRELEQMCLERGILPEDVLRANGHSTIPPAQGEVLLVPESKSAIVPTWMEVQSRKNGDEPLVTIKLHGVPLFQRQTPDVLSIDRKAEIVSTLPPTISEDLSNGVPPSSPPMAPEETIKNMRLVISGDEVIVIPGEKIPDSGDDRAPAVPSDSVTPPKLPPATPSVSAVPGKLMWPVAGKVSSGFGRRGKRHFHAGLDIPMPKKTPIRAALDGVVLETATTKTPKYRGYGNVVLLDHGNGLVTMYAHCLSFSVKKGQAVKQGDVVGLVGNTGRATTHHVHFEVRKDGRPINPVPLMAER